MEHRISSAYHPQTNGLDERTNQTLVRTLKKLASTKEEWDQCIDAALYAYRISVQDSSRFSPFFLIYNRHPRKAIDFELATADGPTSMTDVTEETIEQTMEKLLDARKEYHKEALGNIQVAQERQKTYFDAKHDSNHVRVLKLVWCELYVYAMTLYMCCILPLDYVDYLHNHMNGSILQLEQKFFSRT